MKSGVIAIILSLVMVSITQAHLSNESYFSAKNSSEIVDNDEDKNAKALRVLKTVYEKYDALSSLSMDIGVTIMDGDYSYKKQGTVQVKGNKFRLDTEDEKIVSNGNTLWVFLKSDKSLQISTATKDNQNFFCYPTKLLQKYQPACAVELISEVNENYVLQLNSYNDSCPYEKIKVSINKYYQITDITVLEADDMGYTISISNVKKNISLNDDNFTFDASNIQKSKIRDLRTQ